MATIQAPHYEQARQRLVEDPVVKAMAQEVRGVKLDQLAHEDGTPRFEFMRRANDEYERRTGRSADAHIGAVAEVILSFIRAAVAAVGR